MKLLDLFSGIGGFSLGLERAGFKTVAFCEIEPFCQAVLRKHWPNVPVYTDIRELTAQRLAEDGISAVDAICGGFPCQPVSHAGKQLGKDDNRWLWPEYRRLIQELRPSWVIGENVIGLVGMELDGVLADLESMGYACGAFDIPACAIGAPHQRRRIWIIANPKSKFSNGSESQYGSEFIKQAQSEFGERLSTSFADHRSQRIQGRFKSALSRFCGISWGENGGGSEVSGIRPNLPQPTISRIDDGIRNRLHALGNAVVPQIPEIIGKTIMASELRLRRGRG
jgi:DNA (cytosine-5)-methyltransferase 1